MGNPSPPPQQYSTFRIIRNRVIAGLVVVLPLFITWIVIKWLYDTLVTLLIGPIRDMLINIWYPINESAETDITGDGEVAPAIDAIVGDGANDWLISGMASIAAFLLVLGLLFIAGMFFQSRLHRFLDWFLSSVPGVKTIYTAVKNVVDAFQTSTQSTEQFKRVVLVKFPHSGMKAPAFVTSEIKDSNNDRTILCIYVPTTPIPTSGYMLLVPEEEVVPLDWDLQETLQAIVSGGISVPNQVRYDSIEIPKINTEPPKAAKKDKPSKPPKKKPNN